MTKAAALLFSFVALLSPAPEGLLRRGYELLPNARWRQELDRDRSTGFLGMVLPSLPRSGGAPIDLNFAELDYDRNRLYPDEEPRAALKLRLRADLNRWSAYDARIRGQLPRTPYQPPEDPLLSDLYDRFSLSPK